MGLTLVLEIDEKLLLPQHDQAMELAERLWLEAGCPSEQQELSATLKSVLRHCQRDGTEYPKVLLLRKKSLDRGTWQPARRVRASQPVAATPGACEECNGNGFKPTAGGKSGSLCMKCMGKGRTGKAECDATH